MENRQHRQKLAQQQQHLARTQLQLVVTDAVLPVAHEPERSIQFQAFATSGQLRMQEGLQLRPKALQTIPGSLRLQLTDGHRQISRHDIHTTPE